MARALHPRRAALPPQTPGYPSGDGNCPGPCDCGAVPCGEYLFDHTNATLGDWIVNEIMGPTAMGNANISGFYLDDEVRARAPATCAARRTT